jgi:hypothetical protein
MGLGGRCGAPIAFALGKLGIKVAILQQVAQSFAFFWKNPLDHLAFSAVSSCGHSGLGRNP